MQACPCNFSGRCSHDHKLARVCPAYLEAFPLLVYPEKEAMSHPPEKVKPAEHQDSLNGYVAGHRICGLVAAGTSPCFLGALADISHGPHRDGSH